MEQYFASLSKRQTMLLLTSLAFGGSNAVEAYQHLPPEEAELLTHRAQALLQIPREKRIPFLVQEMKRLVTQRRKQLGSADPKRLAQLLSRERPALIEIVLRVLPSHLADSVRALLPKHTPVKLTREVRPDVLSIIRWKLEDALKGSATETGFFRFSDVISLQPRELLTICDRMGARVLATALAGLSEQARDAFFSKLPPDQRQLALKAAEAGKARRLNEDDAMTVLDMHNANANPSVGMRSAGVQRLARAAVAHSHEFAQKLVERHPGDFGRLLQQWVREEKNRPLKGDGGRADIVEQMERLAQRGIIDRPVRIPQLGHMAPPPKAEKAPAKSGLPGGKVVAPIPKGARGKTGQRAALDPEIGQKTGKRPALTASAVGKTGKRAALTGTANRKTGKRRTVTSAETKPRRVLREGRPEVSRADAERPSRVVKPPRRGPSGSSR